MKKFLKITGILVFLIIAALVAVPYLYKDKLVRIIKDDLNRNLTARVDFDEVDLSLFRHFPDLYLEINHLEVINKDSVFRDIPLARIGKIGLTLDLSALWSGKKEVKDIALSDADFMVLVRPDGKANYDIAAMSDTTQTGDESPLQIRMKHYSARNLRLLYDDRSLNMRIYLAGLDYEGSTDIGGGIYRTRGTSKADTLDVTYDGIRYLKNARVRLADSIEIRNDFNTFIFRDISGTVNALPVFFRGQIDMRPNDDIAMDLQFGTARNSLAKLMSLVPDTYMPEINDLDIDGKASVQGSVKGIYNEKQYPAYHIAFRVDNGMIKGKQLPQRIEQIRVDTRVDFPGGGDLDATLIDMPVIRFTVAGNPLDGRLQVRHPMTDPLVNTAFKGHLDLGGFRKAIPMKSVKKLDGKLDADFALRARVSDMEKQRTDRIDARGYFNLTDFIFATDSLPYAIGIPRAETHITPTAWQLDRLQIRAGQSDFDLQGKAVNYLAYATGRDSTLRAEFTGHSRFINVNELTGGASSSQTQTADDSLTAPRIPAGLDIVFTHTADRVRYGDMDLHNLKARVSVRHRKAELQGVLAKAFGGQIDLTGTYDTSAGKPYTSLKVDMQKLAVDQTASSLSLMKTYAPILKQIRGRMNMFLQAGMNLDDHLNPQLATTDATGDLETDKLKPQNAAFFQNLASLMQWQALARPEIDRAKVHFAIDKGTLHIKPFDFKYNGMKSSLGGKVMLDQSLDLDWNMEIPVEKLGSRASEWLGKFDSQLQKLGLSPAQVKTVYVTFKITGNVMHPQIRPVFRKGAGMQGLVETVKENVTETVKQEAQQVIDTTRQIVDARAQELIREAERRGDSLIAEAHRAGDRLRAEADRRARELEAKASNPLEKYAARKAADKIRKEADRRARELEDKARREKENLIKRAKEEADRLRKKDIKVQ